MSCDHSASPGHYNRFEAAAQSAWHDRGSVHKMMAMPRYQELTLTMNDGYAVYARYWAVPHPRRAVLYLHGIQSHCGWYEESAGRLQDSGCAVLQPDRRGSGRNMKDRGHAESAEQLIDDGMCCAQELLSRSGLSSYRVVGVSWGARVASGLAIRCRPAVDGVVAVSPGWFPRVGVSNRDKLKIGLSMLGNRDRRFDIPLNDPELFTAEPRWIDFLRQDSLTLRQATASFFLVSRRMDGMVRRFAAGAPLAVHAFLGGQDQIIDGPRTAAFIRELNWPATTITHYPQARHTLEFEAVCEHYWSDLVQRIGDSP